MSQSSTHSKVIDTLEKVLYYLTVEADKPEYRANELIGTVRSTLKTVKAEMSIKG